MAQGLMTVAKTEKVVKAEAILEEVAPEYWEQACKELMKQDRILKKLIPKYGSGFLVTRGDPFNTLARAIVGQQISVAAAQSVWNRVVAASKKKVTPKNILALSVEELRAAGLSGRKVEYIRDLADHFDSGRLHANQWKDMELNSGDWSLDCRNVPHFQHDSTRYPPSGRCWPY